MGLKRTTPVTTPDYSPGAATMPKHKSLQPDAKGAKPYADYPLGYHKGSGQWCKKVRGKLVVRMTIAEPDDAGVGAGRGGGIHRSGSGLWRNCAALGLDPGHLGPASRSGLVVSLELRWARLTGLPRRRIGG